MNASGASACSLILLGTSLILNGCGPSPSTPSPTAAPRPKAVESARPSPSREPRPPSTVTPTTTYEATLPLATATPLVLPAGLDLTLVSIDMITAKVGWATGGIPPFLDRVLRSEDGGHTWADVSPPEPFSDARLLDPETSLVIGHFFDERAAIVVYRRSGIVWRTDDGGLSWKPSTGSIHSQDRHILSFPTKSTGWALTSLGHLTGGREVANLYRSRDGGINWENIVDSMWSPYLQECTKIGLEFADDMVGWITLACQEWSWVSWEGSLATGEVFLETTSDGGETWTDLPLPPPAQDVRLFAPPVYFGEKCLFSTARLFSRLDGTLALSCDIVDQRDGAAKEANYLYRTFDGGASWVTHEMPGGQLEVIDQQHMWSIQAEPSGRFRIYRSGDGGASWSLVKTTTWSGQFSFVDERLVFAVAFSTPGSEVTALVRSADGGTSWEVIQPVTAPSESTLQPTLAEIPPDVPDGTWTPTPSD